MGHSSGQVVRLARPPLVVAAVRRYVAACDRFLAWYDVETTKSAERGGGRDSELYVLATKHDHLCRRERASFDAFQRGPCVGYGGPTDRRL